LDNALFYHLLLERLTKTHPLLISNRHPKQHHQALVAKPLSSSASSSTSRRASQRPNLMVRAEAKNLTFDMAARQKMQAGID
jgi:hypothetical protein